MDDPAPYLDRHRRPGRGTMRRSDGIALGSTNERGALDAGDRRKSGTAPGRGTQKIFDSMWGLIVRAPVVRAGVPLYRAAVESSLPKGTRIVREPRGLQPDVDKSRIFAIVCCARPSGRFEI